MNLETLNFDAVMLEPSESLKQRGPMLPTSYLSRGGSLRQPGSKEYRWLDEGRRLGAGVLVWGFGSAGL